MIVVSDTTPLHYLVLINRADVLPALFMDVYTPPEVLRELQHPRTPDVVRRWAQAPPDWLKVRAPAMVGATPPSLDPGEAQAIALAQELGANLLLIDEREGRKIALRQGLNVVGTLAVLERASEKNLLELKQALDDLQQTNFRIHPRYIQAALHRDSIRRGQR